ncbi:MAG: hypothetical protein ABR946_11970 [Solirubrobacteraceae bacterium]
MVPGRRGLVARCRCQVARRSGHVPLIGCVGAVPGGVLAPSAATVAEIAARVVVGAVTAAQERAITRGLIVVCSGLVLVG